MDNFKVVVLLWMLESIAVWMNRNISGGDSTRPYLDWWFSFDQLDRKSSNNRLSGQVEGPIHYVSTSARSTLNMWSRKAIQRRDRWSKYARLSSQCKSDFLEQKTWWIYWADFRRCCCLCRWIVLLDRVTVLGGTSASFNLRPPFFRCQWGI